MWKHVAVAVLLQLIAFVVVLFVTLHDLKVREFEVLDKVQKEAFHAHQVFPNVWVGSYPSSLQYHHLKKNNITHVISIVKGVRVPPISSAGKNLNYLVINAHDMPEQNLLEHFELAHDFIEGALKKNESVLVHCHAGVSRSATVAISYIMKSLGCDRETAHQLARQARRVILPNAGFVQQLEHYETHLLNADDNTKHISHPQIMEKIAQSFPVKADAVKICRGDKCTYLEGSSMGEWIESAKQILSHILHKYLYPKLGFHD